MRLSSRALLAPSICSMMLSLTAQDESFHVLQYTGERSELTLVIVWLWR